MNNLKMLLEEILPFYFFCMLFVILFTPYRPTTFELYIVYAFAFGVALFNNSLYKQNLKYYQWGTDSLKLIDTIQAENKALINEVNDLNDKLEWIEFSSNAVSNEEGEMSTPKNGKKS
jgi:hypothetical protein